MVKFIDLHCDTITKCMENNENLYENSLHLDLKRLKKYDSSVQVFAIWLKRSLYNDAYLKTKQFIKFFEKEIELNHNYINKAISFKEIEQNLKNKKHSAILSIEGGECLMGDIEKLEELYKDGVRIFSLCWNYENELGYGVFEDSTKHLKEKGILAIKKANDLGMILDVSHLNEAGFWDIYKFSEKPFLATHSNSFFICKNKRNLKDSQIKAIKEKDGLIGINFYKNFLSSYKNAEIEHIIFHIDYISKLIGFENIAIGGDLDGIDETLKNLEDISKYDNLFNILYKKYGQYIAQKIFFENAYNFFKKYM